MIDAPERVPDLARVRIFAVFVCIGLFAILARLWYLQVAHGDELQEASMVNQRRLIRRVPPRGQIEDIHGHVLASNRLQMVVSVLPYELKGNSDILPRLAKLIDRPLSDLEDELKSLIKTSSYETYTVKENVSMETVTLIEEQRVFLPGVYVYPEPVRIYPDGALFGHIMGQMGQIQPEELKRRRDEGYQPGDTCGRLGLEKFYDAELRGKNGGREIEVDARGRLRHEVANSNPIPGDKVSLTIDTELQKVAYDELMVWAKRHGDPGAAVVLDVNTGAVKCIASVPSYDPNMFVNGVSKADWKTLQEDPLKPQINRAVGMRLAPGSTFKLVTAAAGLETGETDSERTEFCSGSINLGKWIKRCHKLSGHGTLSLEQAIAKSCDIYFYRLGQRLGPERMAEFARKFGLGSKTGIDLPIVEDAGVVPDTAWKRKHKRGPWVGGDTVDFAIGQASLACTPLQMCNITAAIANGGTLYKPQLVNSISEYDSNGQLHVVSQITPKPLKSLEIKPSTLRQISKGMKAVMQPGGTGYYCNVPGISACGKSGTAQVRYKGETVNNAWFVCYAPAEDPKIAVCVFVEHAGHGGDVAGPIARKLMAKYFKVALPTPAAQSGSGD